MGKKLIFFAASSSLQGFGVESAHAARQESCRVREISGKKKKNNELQQSNEALMSRGFATVAIRLVTINILG